MNITEYSARIYPAGYFKEATSPDHIWSKNYQVQLVDGSTLEIPLTPLPGGQEAIALLMSNQSDFSVTNHLTSLLAGEAAKFSPDCIAAIPTMGLEYAAQVAQKLGHQNYVAMGFSQKFWYDSNIYEGIQSSTSASQLKKLFLDPHLVPRVQGKKVIIVDDVINTGASVLAAIRLLTRLGANVVATLLMLTEGRAWEETLKDPFIAGHSTIKSIGHLPVFRKNGDGWSANKASL